MSVLYAVTDAITSRATHLTELRRLTGRINLNAINGITLGLSQSEFAAALTATACA